LRSEWGMGRRKPNIVPHLSSGGKVPESPLSAKRRGIVPSQTTLSVQTVPDYSTPAGAAQANEEFRRLRMGIENLRLKIDEAASTTPQVSLVKPKRESIGSTGGDDKPKDDKPKDDKPKDDKSGGGEVTAPDWALTILEGHVMLNPLRRVQALRFDRETVWYGDRTPRVLMPVEFKIRKEQIDPLLKTRDDAAQMRIVAHAVTERLDWHCLLPFGSHSIERRARIIVHEDGSMSLSRIFSGVFAGMAEHVYQLVNDEEEPGENKYYGTNQYGIKGWHSLPTLQLGYVHNQEEISTEWHIHHNLGFYPSVTCEDINGVDVSCTVEYLNENEVKCYFKTAIKGIAYLS